MTSSLKMRIWISFLWLCPSRCQPNHCHLIWFDSVRFRVFLMFLRQSGQIIGLFKKQTSTKSNICYVNMLAPHSTTSHQSSCCGVISCSHRSCLISFYPTSTASRQHRLAGRRIFTFLTRSAISFLRFIAFLRESGFTPGIYYGTHCIHTRTETQR